MSYIKAGTDASGNDIKLFYQDLGTSTGTAGSTVVLIHGWPLSHEMWDYQLAELPAHGLGLLHMIVGALVSRVNPGTVMITTHWPMI